MSRTGSGHFKEVLFQGKGRAREEKYITPFYVTMVLCETRSERPKVMCPRALNE